MHFTHRAMLKLSRVGLGLHLKLHRLPKTGGAAHKKMEGAATTMVRRKVPLSFRF